MEGDELASLGATAYEAYKNQDEDAVRGLLSENVVWHALQGGGSFNDFVGLEAVLGYIRQSARMARISGTFDIELGEVFTHGRYAVGLHTAQAERDGDSLLDREVLVGRAEEGRIVEIWQFFEDPARTQEFFGT